MCKLRQERIKRNDIDSKAEVKEKQHHRQPDQVHVGGLIVYGQVDQHAEQECRQNGIPHEWDAPAPGIL